MSEHWHPLLLFPDESASFVHGFEGGIVWAQIEAGMQTIERTVHTANETLYRRMAERMGYGIEFDASEVEGWAELRMVKRCPASHLRVVS
jgi:hypothetical protein